MNILVLGSKGMLGRYVSTYLNKKYTVYGTDRSHIDAATADKDDILNQLKFPVDGKDIKIDLVINCIGMIKPVIMTNPTSTAIKVNSLFPHLVSEVCKEHDIKFIHVTTDCVYSGKLDNPELGYDEDDLHDAEDVYGVTKFLGEPEDCTVIRTSIIGEEVNQSRSLIEWVKSKRNQGADGYTNHYWNGVTCLQFAKIVERMVEGNHFWTGTKHIHSNAVDKHQLLEIINKHYNLNIEINPTEGSEYCNRTMSSIYEDALKLNPETLDEQIKELAKYSDELNAGN